MTASRWLTVAVVVSMTQLVGCGLVPGVPTIKPASGAPGGGPAFGTLLATPAHTREENQAGVSAAMVELSWEQFEPDEGKFSKKYIQGNRTEIDELRASGRTITLGLGMHEDPDWLRDIPDSRLVDSSGKRSKEPNLVFNQELRDAAEKYIAAVAAGIDLSQVDTVRLTSGGLDEALFPDGAGYWAFDPNAQNGPHRPPSMAPNPAPGWHPGDGGLTEQQVRQWADWYVGALADAVKWQIDVLAKNGFHGTYEVLTPGVGVRPREYTKSVRQGLPEGQLTAGSAWDVFYRQLPRRNDIVAYISSVADDSGNNDSCNTGDKSVALDSPEVERWSATRWVSRVAAEYGYRVSGENPGFQQSFSPEDSYRDTSDKGMLAAAVRQARTCGFRTFYWAHDKQLWDGTVPFRAYAERIAKTG